MTRACMHTPPQRLTDGRDAFPQVPPLKPGFCNFCGKKTGHPARKTCSPACRRLWRNLMNTIGRQVAERMVYRSFRRHDKPMPPTAKRARSEAETIAERTVSRLRGVWASVARNTGENHEDPSR